MGGDTAGPRWWPRRGSATTGSDAPDSREVQRRPAASVNSHRHFHQPAPTEIAISAPALQNSSTVPRSLFSLIDARPPVERSLASHVSRVRRMPWPQRSRTRTPDSTPAQNANRHVGVDLPPSISSRFSCEKKPAVGQCLPGRSPHSRSTASTIAPTVHYRCSPGSPAGPQSNDPRSPYRRRVPSGKSFALAQKPDCLHRSRQLLHPAFFQRSIRPGISANRCPSAQSLARHFHPRSLVRVLRLALPLPAPECVGEFGRCAQLFSRVSAESPPHSPRNPCPKSNRQLPTFPFRTTRQLIHLREGVVDRVAPAVLRNSFKRPKFAQRIGAGSGSARRKTRTRSGDGSGARALERLGQRLAEIPGRIERLKKAGCRSLSRTDEDSRFLRERKDLRWVPVGR